MGKWYSLVLNESWNCAMRKSMHRISKFRSMKILQVVGATTALMWVGSSPAFAGPTGQPHPGETMSASRDRPNCPGKASLRSLAALGSVYIGEVHGTAQTPALVQCLVDLLVADKTPPFTVSLELPSSARNFEDPVWSGVDGRTSQAMASLVKHLVVLEDQKKIAIDFQIKQGMDFQKFDHDNGMALRELAAKGRLIAYGGNTHAQRRQVFLQGSNIQPAGSFTGPTVVTVLIDPVADGSAWDCETTCGVHPVSSFQVGNKLGELRKDDKYGFDLVYVIAAFTPSPPLFPAAVPEPR
jgi:hypothetical protein